MSNFALSSEQLENNTHRLRAIEPTDVPALLRLENDASMWWLGATITPYSEATMIKYATGGHDLHRDKQLRLMLDWKTDNVWITVGAMDLYEFDASNMRAGVGVAIETDARRKGHAAMGLELLKKYGLETLGLHQLYAEVPCSHNPSMKLFERCGFTATEQRKDWLKVNGEWKDVVLFQTFSKY